MLSKIKEMFPKELAWLYWLTLLTAALITWSGIALGQTALRITPLYISLIVGILQARANRYALLLGSFNCLLYFVALLSVKLYASAANTLFISAPMQFITFLRWNKQPYKQSTHFRKMTPKLWAVTGVLFVIGFFILRFWLNKANASSPLLDTIGTLVGFLCAILTLLSFREYSWLALIGSLNTIVLFTSLLPTHPDQLTYVFYATHSLVCTFRQFLSVRHLYREQIAK